ncbi:protein mono-ADP-ribosyltransferase PARP14-like [Aulostomus maculatus]
MGDPYRHPIFFETAHQLDGNLKKKIKNYFTIKRVSGGGECGPLTNLNGCVYSIAFEEEVAQQRVLQKSKHVVELAGISFELTVQATSPVARLDPEPNSVQQAKHPTPASGSPPCDEEYELQLDAYLLHYLKESPKAEKQLEEELASVACSAQLYPDKGKVLVKRSVLSGAVGGDGIRKWEAEVDTLFERIEQKYHCHYETDPHKVSALLQYHSLPQVTDEVKVYSEAEKAVVVGECSKLEAMLMAIEVSLHKNGPSRGICRLGKAKLNLLWKEMEPSLQQEFPGVKVSKGDEGQLVLEGSVEETLRAKEWIYEEEKMVIERSVSDMSPHLLAFLRKAHGDGGELGDFLKVGPGVEMELRDTELYLFSRFTDNLNATEMAVREKFKEVNIDIPNCSIVLSQLREKLESKAKEMNQGHWRVWPKFGSGSAICLLGNTKEVTDLEEVVTQFILDQASTESKVTLPFPELAQLLPELLQLHGLDYSGVTFHPFTFSSAPMVVLEGPSSRVTAVRNGLKPLVDSLHQDKVVIDLPGAERYFQSSPGRENLLRVGHSQKCLIKLKVQPQSSGQNSFSVTHTSYCLLNGLQVLVCEGDITKQHADALVNAANENLEHSGGVAAALSRAGGPQVQEESRAFVKQHGKVCTSEVAVTSGGKLNCKKLLHVVGPIAGAAGGKERFLLEETVQSALNSAEEMKFQSIAIPCISSGIFGVSVSVCTEAIVTAVREFASRPGRSLKTIILIDNRKEVARSMQEACDRLLQGMTTARHLGFQMGAAGGGTSAGAPGDGVHVEVVQGAIETQQVDVLVSPMAGHDPLSTHVGHCLSSMVGHELKTMFHREAQGATLPGDTVFVLGLPHLHCKAVIFLNIRAWDRNKDGAEVQALRKGIQNVLASCESKHFSSVAFPVLGTGRVLRFDHSVAARVLLEEIGMFEQKRARGTSFLVRIVVHPQDKESAEALQAAQKMFHLRGFTNYSNPDQVPFYRHVSSADDEVTAMLDTVKLQMVHGNIVQETTEVIVNTTDFSGYHSGVSKAILSAAGPSVQRQFAKVGIPANYMCTTGPGLLHCREIIHASFKSDVQWIIKNIKKILKQCENKGYRSVAFPAINTGVGGMDFGKACKAMLDGMASAITDLKPTSLSLIRIIIWQQEVFTAFRSELKSRFGEVGPHPESTWKEKAMYPFKKLQEKYFKSSPSSPLQDLSSKPPPALINVIGCGSDIFETIKRDLEKILQQQLVERELDVGHFTMLDAMELETVKAKVTNMAVSLERRRCSASSQEVYILKGLKEDVLNATELVNKAIQKHFSKTVHQ